MHDKRKLSVIDVTLREAEKAPGIYFSAERKVEIARVLAELGVRWVELGNPAADPDLDRAITRVAKAGVGATVGACIRPRLDDVKQALSCGVGLLSTTLSAWPERLKLQYELEPQAAQAQVFEAVAFARSQRKDLLLRHSIEDIADAPIDHIAQVAKTALKAGADIIGLVDGTGRLSPFAPGAVRAETILRELKARLGPQAAQARFSIECRNDLGLALANTLDALANGAEFANTSILGLGEGAGGTDLVELLVNLRETFDAAEDMRFFVLNRLYNLVSRYSRRIINFNHPLVGHCAFTHYSGVHVKAVREDPTLYQSLDPDDVGRGWSLALGPQSGRASIELALELVERHDLAIDKDLVADILDEVKARGKSGGAIELGQAFLGIVWRCEQRRRRIKKSA
ncbi:MAG: LeuA family protein [Myxococcaceae bacterium]